MTAQTCRKHGVLSSSAIAGVVSSGELEVFLSERGADGRTRQSVIQLYGDLRPPLFAYLCCLGMTADQAEDVIQETFLRLVDYRFTRGTQEHLRAWIYRVAHNLSMDVHRFQRRWSLNDEDERHGPMRSCADPAPTPEQRVLLDERMRRFAEAFAQLTPRQRQCVLLRAEGMRYREIARTLGVSVQRVGELMQRSITLLGIDR
jgi:RNA polymerase sigma-70 factor, ECF subfamily